MKLSKNYLINTVQTMMNLDYPNAKQIAIFHLLNSFSIETKIIIIIIAFL